MKNDEERLRWAVEFSRTNVMALKNKTARLDELRESVGSFLGIDQAGSFDVHVSVTQKPFPDDLSAFDLHGLSQVARELLTAVEEGHGLHGAVEVPHLLVDLVGPSDHRTLRLGGSVRSGFVMVLAFLLTTRAGRQVTRCRECGRLFYKVRRQIYCTSECTDRATWKNVPEEKKRKYRKKQYAKHGWKLGARSSKVDKITNKEKSNARS